MTDAAASRVAPGRTCGDCTLCCKVLTIEALAKPSNVWCAHCKPGKGCGNYEARPDECRKFHCMWMVDGGFGPEWRPDRAKFMIAIAAGGERVVVHCDAGAPTAWRREPYYSTIKAWASKRTARQREVLVRIGRRSLLITATGEADLGELGPGDRVVTTYDQSDRLVDVRVVRSDAAPEARAS